MKTVNHLAQFQEPEIFLAGVDGMMRWNTASRNYSHSQYSPLTIQPPRNNQTKSSSIKVKHSRYNDDTASTIVRI